MVLWMDIPWEIKERKGRHSVVQIVSTEVSEVNMVTTLSTVSMA